MAKGVRYTEEFRELPLQALEQFRGGARVADDGREPEDGQRFPSCVFRQVGVSCLVMYFFRV
ncbi:hypothetical protein BL5914_00050 [Bifidobacterium longum subsp. longum]|uniref:hypothetical protein n=1 Tax=Bifidobacterium longum TaxID=216816 RepID=UPI001865E48A|nr:hypothetical protein [Bifidobacterium longum]QOL28164.1 hypothetical protein BL5914_00050 [Bifidobacterium longum subsp. longum]QOL29750.1 hypothetical protein BL5934_08835 [Bifidobacterium longum subsp. infantis]